MKTYIKRQQHKSIKHQDIKQKEAPQKFASESEWFTSDCQIDNTSLGVAPGGKSVQHICHLKNKFYLN